LGWCTPKYKSLLGLFSICYDEISLFVVRMPPVVVCVLRVVEFCYGRIIVGFGCAVWRVGFCVPYCALTGSGALMFVCSLFVYCPRLKTNSSRPDDGLK
jgi:hypothetical protein